jgi:hypothetical protein
MNAAVQATEPKPSAPDANEAFDDSLPNAEETAQIDGEGDASADEAGDAAASEVAAAGRQTFRDALRRNIAAGDDHNRQTEAKIHEERGTAPVAEAATA